MFQRDHHLLSLALAGLVTSGPFLLSGCAALQDQGPRADATLLQLYAQARDDASAATSPELAALRSTQASELLAEMQRLCGHDDAGAVPTSCTVDDSALPPLKLPEGASADLGAIPALAAKAPAESTALLIHQAVELARVEPDQKLSDAADAVIKAGTKIKAADVAAMQDLLEWEYGTAYALSTAQAWAPGPQVEAAIAATHERITALTRLLDYAGGKEGIPSPQPSYTFTDIAPTDAASATSVIDTAQAEAGRKWELAAASASGEALRRLAIIAAAQLPQG